MNIEFDFLMKGAGNGAGFDIVLPGLFLFILTGCRVMDRGCLENFREWFDRYANGFYGDDDFVNANVRLKHEHSFRTCEEMSYLCGELGLDEGRRLVAETIALFHDIGRFEQFVKYRTYVDIRSVDHSALGVDILGRTKILEGLEANERRWIEEAVAYHGRKELPNGLDGESVLFARLIRDADKVDIYRVVVENYEQYKSNPAEFLYEIELPDEPGYSAEVAEAVLNEERTDYGKLRTLHDIMLLQLGWVYDVNFAATLKRIRQRKFLETIAGWLPRCEQIEAVREKVLAYVDFRIEQEG